MSKNYEKEYGKPKVRSKKGKYVENGVFGKIIRLIGFLAIGLSSFYLLLDKIRDGAGINAVPGFDKLYDILSGLGLYSVIDLDIVITLSPYLPLFFFGGLILLVWCLTNSTFGKVFSTIILVGGLVSDYINHFFFGGFPDFFKLIPVEQINNIIPTDYSNYIFYGLFFLGFACFWLILINKKPFRFSGFFLRLGADILLIVVIIHGVVFLVPSVRDAVEGFGKVLSYITSYGYGSVYALFTVSTVFGILGAFRK
jgi:hypothetical protein